jgi:hypothetical protein
MGNIDTAYYSARQALALGIEDSVPENIGAAWRVLGMISAKSGKPVSIRKSGLSDPDTYDAQACFSKSAQILADADIKGERARTLREWARYEATRNNKEWARELWDEARLIFDGLGANFEVERMEEPPAP